MKPTPPRNPLRTAHSLVLLALVFASLPLSAQSPSASQPPSANPTTQPPLRFEVASIRPHPFAGDEPSNRRILPGGRFVATATTARTLLRIAFGTDDNRMSGAPKWVDDQLFDITATTVDRTDVKTPEQFQQLILSLLEDRFQLKFHREQKEGPVYWLEVYKPGKLGPALKPAPANTEPNMSTNSNGAKTVMNAANMSMTDIAAALRRQAGRPVENHTGLNGTFNFQIEWAPEETPDSTDQSLFTVLKEQLGLKLQPAKGVIELLVIDHITEPSAN
jgi:uncharacterized protein (TIGR03435 family)